MQTTILILSIIGAVGFILLFRKRKPSQKIEPADLTKYKWDDFDIELVMELNEYRESIGLDMLVMSQLLCDLYATHSEYMAKQGKASHDNFENRAEFMKPINIGEVVCPKRNEPKSVLQGWKSSPEHNVCITSTNYKQIGISHAFDKSGNKFVCAILSE